MIFHIYHNDLNSRDRKDHPEHQLSLSTPPLPQKVIQTITENEVVSSAHISKIMLNFLPRNATRLNPTPMIHENTRGT